MDKSIWDLLCKSRKQEENKIKEDKVVPEEFGISQKAKEIQLQPLFLLEAYHTQALKTVLLNSLAIAVK